VIHNDTSSKSQVDGYCWLLVYLMTRRVSCLGVNINYELGGVSKKADLWSQVGNIAALSLRQKERLAKRSVYMKIFEVETLRTGKF